MTTLEPLPAREGDRVFAPDTRLPGRVTAAYKNGAYLRVTFPPGSPFFDDWAIYEQHELTTTCKPPSKNPPQP